MLLPLQMPQKPATIKEIANRLNVSISTVSRALHNHPSIGLKTRMEVQQLAKELQYEPNQAAISFKQGKTMIIGVILPNLGEEYFSIAINGIEDMASKNNYTVLIGQSHDDTEREIKIVDTMRRQRVDGLIVSLSKSTTTYEHFFQLKKYQVPLVFFDRIPNLPDAYCVSCNLENSSIQLTDLLVNRGHTRIGFIKGPDSILHSTQRLEGYFEGLWNNKLVRDDDLIVQTNLDRKSTEAAMAKLLAVEDRPTAVITFNDYVALDAIRYTREQGLKINKDIYFVSYANLPITSYLDDPPLASVEQFPYEQAERATDILIRLIAKQGNDESIPKKTVLESKVVVNVK
ncbi:MAG TPA: LacI family DNA-binding transcriptional regulator [Chitinophagaceae bacterium]|nr:LacI family DNA-binding transcriptional regulator [Chitinophagaceae bacterium]